MVIVLATRNKEGDPGVAVGKVPEVGDAGVEEPEDTGANREGSEDTDVDSEWPAACPTANPRVTTTATTTAVTATAAPSGTKARRQRGPETVVFSGYLPQD
jgi:hypothetical protein